MPDDDRVERHRKFAGEQAMQVMDLTTPEYLRAADQASDAIQALALFLRQQGKDWEYIIAATAGLTATVTLGTMLNEEL